MKENNSAQNHVRINDTLLGPLERAFIKWFVGLAPDWVTPDLMTYIGLFGSICIFIGYVFTNLSPHFLWLACFGMFLNWFGDSLDGNLARYRHTERPRYGFFLDHSVDSISMFLVFIGLGLSPYVKLNVALFGLVGYLLMSIFVYVDTITNGTFQISFAKLGPTEARGIMIIANILMFLIGNPIFRLPTFGSVTLYDFIVSGIAILLILIYLVMIAVRLRMLAKLEPYMPHKQKEKKSTSKIAEHHTSKP